MLANLKTLRDHQLLSTAKILVTTERSLQRQQIEVFSEIARRRLHLKAGYDSLFTYLVRELGYSKACAYQRSVIAKASEQWPCLLTMIEDKVLTLATAVLLTKHLNAKNCDELIQLAIGKTKEELEILLARRSNTPVIRDSVRPVAVRAEVVGPASPSVGGASLSTESARSEDAGPKAGGSDLKFGESGAETSGGAERAIVEEAIGTAQNPLAPRPEDVVVKVSFATNKRVSDKLSRVKDLLARKLPQGALSDVLETLLDDYLQRHDPQIKAQRAEAKTQRLGAKARQAQAKIQQAKPATKFESEPRNDVKTDGCGTLAVLEKNTRYIPASVKREVQKRDGGRCSYVSSAGVRCGATRYLEYDHVRPFALAGRSDDLENVRLLCAQHNRERARETFGWQFREA